MKRLITLFIILLSTSVAHADDPATPCASKVFAENIAAVANQIDPFADEIDVKTQLYAVFADKDVLSAVLNCPEIARANETDTIKFTPIRYEFSNGREIVINYETQPKLLKQKIALAGKRRLPSSDPNPRVGDINDDAMWTNTNPAWYAIMVTQSGALRDFVGPDKNNTVSLQYIADNMDKLYPNGMLNGGLCTSRSAIAGDDLPINSAGKITTGEDQDFYIAGDINLEWIGYAEVAAEVILTIATMGGSAAVSGTVKGARALSAMKNLSPILKALENSADVKKFIDRTDDLADVTKRIDDLTDAGKTMDKSSDAFKRNENLIDQLKKNKKNLETEIKDLEKIDDVSEYKKTAGAMEDMVKYLDDLGVLNKKATKISKEAGKLRSVYNATKKTENAQKYRKVLVTQQRATKELDELKKARKLLDEANEIAPDMSKINKNIANYEKQIEKLKTKLPDTMGSQKRDINRQIKNLEQQINNQRNLGKNPKKLTGKDKQNAIDALDQKIKGTEKNLETINDSIKELEKIDDVKQYKEASEKYSELVKISHIMKNGKVLSKAPKRGNVFTRASKKIKGTKVMRGIKAFKTAFSGGDKISKAAKMGRTGSLASKTRNWLFHSTLTAAGSLAKFEAQAGALYMIVSFAADMYDFTSDSTSEFTNNIEFVPYLLLSADDIQEGQDNVVNYGMWLMWLGDSTSAADDDAAFLMANDFAAKFHEDLMEVQGNTSSPCDVDIYVVRPILRNPGEEDGQIYYLIMNDRPWTTSENPAE